MKKILCIIGLIITMISFVSCKTNVDSSSNTNTHIQDVFATKDTTIDTEEYETSNRTQNNIQGSTESTVSGDTSDSPGLPTTEVSTLGTVSQSQTSDNAESTNFEDFISKYSGRWYLDGYFDVYLDISLDANEENILSIQANNFGLPGEGEDGIIYPQEQNLDTYGVGIGIHLSGIFNMKSYSFKEGYICIGSHKFVRTQGSISQAPGISLNKTSLELYVGESETLIATVFPDGAVNKKVTWSSSFESRVAVSSDGKVTGIAATVPGSVEITVTTEDGHYRATCSVIVKEKTEIPTPSPQPIRVSGVQISQAALSLYVGDTQQLSATVLPTNADNINVTWSSSNNSVAQVSSSGQVTAKESGSTTITVTTVDGSYSAKCTVTVEAPSTTEPPVTEPQPVRVSGVRISKTALSLNAGDTQQLSATILPSNADNKNVTWSSSNNAIVQVASSGEVTAIGTGSATITVTTVDGNYSAICTVIVAAPPATEPPTTEPPATEPVSDVLIFSNTQTVSDQTIDTDVYITSTGIVTFNNVTVNGNIYCYGQLKCSGCTANNVYAYAYGSMMRCDAFDGTHGKVSGGISCSNLTILDNALDYAFSKWGKK